MEDRGGHRCEDGYCFGLGGELINIILGEQLLC